MNTPFSDPKNSPFGSSSPTDAAESKSIESKSIDSTIQNALKGSADASDVHAPSASVKEIFAANAQENARPTAQSVKAARAKAAANPNAYKPSGRVGALALPIFLIASPLIGIAIGILQTLIAPHFNLLLVSQVLLGLLLGMALYPAVRWGKCRNPRLAIGAAFVASVVTFLTIHGANVLQLRNDYIDYGTQLMTQAGVPAAQARARAASIITPSRAVQIYIRSQSKYGTVLQSSSASSSSRLSGTPASGTSVTGVWYWLLEAFEFAIITLTACAIAQQLAAARYSEAHDAWFQKKTLYNVHPTRAREVLTFAQNGQWSEAGKAARAGQAAGEGNVVVTVYEVPPSSDGIVTLTQTVNKQHSNLFEMPVSQDNIAQLRAA